MTRVSDQALDQIFREGRSHNLFRPEPIAEGVLQALYDLMKMGPTSANCSPTRLVFVTSAEGKAKLLQQVVKFAQEQVFLLKRNAMQFLCTTTKDLEKIKMASQAKLKQWA